jgi:hypothetical protein
LDKPQYLSNIRRNLKKDGRFIVGDEFLPEHARNDDAARGEALRRYHGCIIELAGKENKSELIKLETDALESGLTNKGDYKLCCSHYNDLVRTAGFTIEHTFRIGPPEQSKFEQVAGIFVYVLV